MAKYLAQLLFAQWIPGSWQSKGKQINEISLITVKKYYGMSKLLKFIITQKNLFLEITKISII